MEYSERNGAVPLKAIFSDLDGTLVHFPVWFEAHGVRMKHRDDVHHRAVVVDAQGEERPCRLLPRTTMGDGVVSDRSVELVSQLRKQGIMFVIVTGARKSTVLERLQFLPDADVVVGESGSRIYIHGELDEAWEQRMRPICGPLEREVDVSQRPEPLWIFCRALQSAGLNVDTRAYYGCFRVDTKGDAQKEALLRKLMQEMPREIEWAMNLGKFDFFPATSGKKNAVEYLQQRYGLRKEECACLFDDDNDLGMAECCGLHMLPALTSASVRRAALEHPDWHVANRADQGVFAVEELLAYLLERVQWSQDAKAPN